MSGTVRAVVTGGGGFLGSRIAAMLVDAGVSVTSFSRRRYPELENSGIRSVQGDLADPAAVKRAFANAEIVFHVASKAGLWGKWDDYYSANVTGTQNVIDACRALGIPRLIYTSTPSVAFGGGNIRNMKESEPLPSKYSCPYPATKAIAERLVLEANSPTLATVALRPHAIWGPGDNHLFPRMIEKYNAGRLMFIGKGENLIDTTFVDNAAQAHLDAARCLTPGQAPAGRAYFISNGEPRTIRGMINALMDIAGLPPVTRSIPLPVAYAAGFLLEKAFDLFRLSGEPSVTRYFALQMARDHYFDISAAHRDFGYRPRISIDEGLRRFRLSYRSQPEAVAAR
jgi:nucleoside-diphosphate-sugar epimerase